MHLPQLISVSGMLMAQIFFYDLWNYILADGPETLISLLVLVNQYPDYVLFIMMETACASPLYLSISPSIHVAYKQSALIVPCQSDCFLYVVVTFFRPAAS